MQKEDKSSQQDKNLSSDQEGLSEVWKELLGNKDSHAPDTPGAQPEKDKELVGDEVAIPTLESDPWRALIQAKGVEVVDLQKKRLEISDQEVEQMLDKMQEQSTQGDEGSSSK
jgi:hypothetical protein